MTQTVELPLWLFVLILLFAVVTFASHFLFPSVRWFFRRRLETAVRRLNKRLERPIEPFKLARRYDMIQRLIHDPAVMQAVSERAAEAGVPENVAFEEARRYAREIVPSFSAVAYFSFAIRAARFLSNAIYRVRVAHVDEPSVAGIDKNATVIFVMNHRSNMDYVLVTYLAADRSALSYAVGEWARVWPLSRLIRAMGAYFIRRRSRNELYRKVLAAYVRLATKGGVTQAIFPEGGLSLDGAMAQAKLGLLKYIVEGSEAQNGQDGKDVVFVPVALNYDRVLEDKILTSAARIGQRRFKARIGIIMFRMLRQFWLWLTGRYHRFGYAAVSFGRPLSLSEIAADRSQDARTKALSRELMARIGEAVPLAPVPVVAWILLHRGAMDRAGLEAEITRLTADLPLAHLHLPEGGEAHAVDVALRQLLRRRLLREGADGRLTIRDGQADLMSYYANSIAHLMPPPDPAPDLYEGTATDAVAENAASARL
ncbi:1-acyl-sn-glycerol-3-phosphate acyltransferase [Tritonibacter multivorans]|nr:1-acyl-sn-glycerol-3-phosphate acyltransferase [Tritonibacter multivorans]MDA7419659.1 1-acyl-sn-glycerol-3-phosphate acyltransferase [Tritonibacter multivorans]SFC58710.1 glycerol-3-phosphate acyltransferase [Tritonibacter multivorans]